MFLFQTFPQQTGKMPKRKKHDGSMLTIVDEEETKAKRIASENVDLANIPRGKPKSGRAWKTTRVNRHSEFKRDKHLKTSWTLKAKERADKKALKKYENELKEAKAKEIAAKKERVRQNKKRQEEMQKRAEIVQTIKNTSKIKRMKKKQLRMIEKR